MSDPRAVPFSCPYCGEPDLRPQGPGVWHCRTCDRRFELRFVGIGPAAAAPEGG
jgi:ribosomal protein L37AE/L43A